MKPFNHILAATDLSVPARHAIARGLRVAAATDARCSVLHALELDAIDSMREWLGEDLDNVKRALEIQAQDALAELLPASGDGNAQAIVATGAPLATITAQADVLAVDLLVLGARGSSFLRHLALGSMASRVLRKTAHCPVLVVKQAPREAYRRLLIAIDFSPVSARVIHLARALAPTAELVLLHAFQMPFESRLAFAGIDPALMQRYRVAARDQAMRHVRQLATEAGLCIGDYTPLVMHGNPTQHILEQEQACDCDLLVVGKHGQSAAQALLLGSVTKHVIAGSQGDVLVINDVRNAGISDDG